MATSSSSITSGYPSSTSQPTHRRQLDHHLTVLVSLETLHGESFPERSSTPSSVRRRVNVEGNVVGGFPIPRNHGSRTDHRTSSLTPRQILPRSSPESMTRDLHSTEQKVSQSAIDVLKRSDSVSDIRRTPIVRSASHFDLLGPPSGSSQTPTSKIRVLDTSSGRTSLSPRGSHSVPASPSGSSRSLEDVASLDSQNELTTAIKNKIRSHLGFYRTAKKSVSDIKQKLGQEMDDESRRKLEQELELSQNSVKFYHTQWNLAFNEGQALEREIKRAKLKAIMDLEQKIAPPTKKWCCWK
ncbi:MAG: hypothetical protein V4487_01000 [Chlamydiota bacterium]